MATAYTLAANATLRDIGNAGIWGVATARTGSDTISTNGFNFTQDQDSRYGLGGNTSAIWGALTILATKGGNLNFDGRYIRLIPFTGGSGTITAGSLITCGSATGKVIGIYAGATMNAAVATAPVLTAATGYIKVTEWNSVAFPTSGAYTQAGFTFTIAGADVVGFMEVDGIEAGTINANRLGAVNITGEWFSLGTTDATLTKTFQLPTNGLLRHSAGVFVEKTAGQKDYEFYPNAGTAATVGTEAARGKVCWITNTGLVRIGNNTVPATMGYHPGTGKEVVVGNIWFENVVTTLTANVIPNSTIATRYDFTTTGGGVINIDKCDMAWYLSCSQAYSVNITNSGFIDAILLSEIATPMTLTKVGVGNKPTTALATAALTMTYCYAGGIFTDCVWTRVTLAASPTVTLTDIAGFTFLRNAIRSNTLTGANLMMAVIATRAKDCTWTNPTVIQGAMNLITCDGIIVTDIIYVNNVSGTTPTTYSNYIWDIASNTINCTFSGLTLPVTNCQPYTAILNAATGCANIKFRNVGTRAVPLSLGATNGTGLVYSLATNCQDFKFQRLYFSNTRTGIMTGDNSSKNITEENVWGDYADAVGVMAVLNYKVKGMGGTGALTAQTSVYGTHWRDGFTSTTAGRIAILMNEPNSLTMDQVTLTGGAAFTSAGGLYMPTIGQTATFETPEYIIGHTAFANSALVMAGGTVTNHQYQYAIDKNDGSGWSALSSVYTTDALFGTALSGITGIDASKGFKLRIKITTSVTNTAAITSVYLTTVSTTTAQDYQYPLDTITLSLTGLQSGSDIVILDAGTSTERTNVDANPGTTYSYVYAATGNIDIGVFKAGYVPFYIRNYPLSTANASLPCAQVIDRAYA